jgi:hypothetical protein
LNRKNRKAMKSEAKGLGWLCILLCVGAAALAHMEQDPGAGSAHVLAAIGLFLLGGILLAYGTSENESA